MPAFDEEGFQLVPEDGPRRLTLREYVERHGYNDDYDVIEHLTSESVAYAMCDSDCRIEVDGRCEHGHPTPLRYLGFV